MSYRITAQAQLDLIEIWEYTMNNWSMDQADKYFQLLITRINELGDESVLTKRYQIRKKLYWGVRIESHIIFYRKSTDGIIEVIRILHKNMDIDIQLP